MAASWWKAWKTSKPLDTEAGPRHKKRQSRMNDVVFQAACKLAGLEPTKRQARKWNNGRGKAILFRRKSKESL